MNDNIGEKEMTEEMGGEVGEEVKRLKSLQHIECHGICLDYISVLDIRGYPHDCGLKDSTGKQWWVYVHCNNKIERNGKTRYCDYNTSWGKIKNG